MQLAPWILPFDDGPAGGPPGAAPRQLGYEAKQERESAQGRGRPRATWPERMGAPRVLVMARRRIMPTNPRPDQPIPVPEPDLARPPAPSEEPQPEKDPDLPQPGPDVVIPPGPAVISPPQPQEVPPMG
jgi:hypothetical protein